MGEGDTFVNENFLYKKKTCALFLELFLCLLLLNRVYSNNPYLKEGYLGVAYSGSSQGIYFLYCVLIAEHRPWLYSVLIHFDALGGYSMVSPCSTDISIARSLPYSLPPIEAFPCLPIVLG